MIELWKLICIISSLLKLKFAKIYCSALVIPAFYYFGGLLCAIRLSKLIFFASLTHFKASACDIQAVLDRYIFHKN